MLGVVIVVIKSLHDIVHGVIWEIGVILENSTELFL